MLGTVRYIFALNIEHHLFISSWAKELPSVKVIGMEGLPEKREKSEATRGVLFAHVLTSGQPSHKLSPEFDAEFIYEFIHSHQSKGIVFFHKQSGILIEADLVWNLPATEQYSRSTEDPTSGALTRFVGGILYAKGDMTWQKHNLWYVAGASNRKEFAL